MAPGRQKWGHGFLGSTLEPSSQLSPGAPAHGKERQQVYLFSNPVPEAFLKHSTLFSKLSPIFPPCQILDKVREMPVWSSHHRSLTLEATCLSKAASCHLAEVQGMEGSQPDVILFLILLRQASGRFTCI
jgi:hypothetical protein